MLSNICIIRNQANIRICGNQNVFSQRIVQDWNSLSEGTIAAATLNMFKSRLDKQWQALKYGAP